MTVQLPLAGLITDTLLLSASYKALRWAQYQTAVKDSTALSASLPPKLLSAVLVATPCVELLLAGAVQVRPLVPAATLAALGLFAVFSFVLGVGCAALLLGVAVISVR